MKLMLKPGWPGAFRRTIAGVCYVFEPGLVVDVPDAHAEELIEGGEVPRAIWPARVDAKGRAKHDLDTLAVLFGDEDGEDGPAGGESPTPEGSDPSPKKPSAKARTRKPAKKPEPELADTGA